MANSIDAFPDELLVHMLAQATPGSVVALSGVSRRFRQVTNGEEVWRPIVLRIVGQNYAKTIFPLLNDAFTWKEAYRFRFFPSLISSMDEGPKERARANNPGPAVVVGFGPVDEPFKLIVMPEVVDRDTTFTIVNYTSVEMVDGQGKHTILQGQPGTLLTHLSHDGKHLYGLTSDYQVIQWDTETGTCKTVHKAILSPIAVYRIHEYHIDFLSSDGRIILLWQESLYSLVEIIDLSSGKHKRWRGIVSPRSKTRPGRMLIDNGKLYIPHHVSSSTDSLHATFICNWETLEQETYLKETGVIAISHKTNRIIGYYSAERDLCVFRDGQEQLTWHSKEHTVRSAAVSGNLVFETWVEENTIRVFDMRTARTISSVSLSNSAVSDVLSELVEIVSTPPPSDRHLPRELPSDVQNQALFEMLAFQKLKNSAVHSSVIKNGMVFSIVNSCDVKMQGIEGVKTTLKGTPGTLLTHLAHDGTSLYALRRDGVIARWNLDSEDYEEISVPRPEKMAEHVIFLANEGFIVTASSGYIEVIDTNTKEFRIIEGIKLNLSRAQMFIRDHKLFGIETDLEYSRMPVAEMRVFNLKTGKPEPVIKVPLKKDPRPLFNIHFFQGMRSCRLMDNNCFIFSTLFESILMDLQGRELVRVPSRYNIDDTLGILGTLAFIRKFSSISIFNIKTKELLVEVKESPHALEELVRFCNDNKDLVNAELPPNPTPFAAEEVTVAQRVFGWWKDIQMPFKPS